MFKIEVPENIKYIIKTFSDNGYEAYTVGGCVRDSLLDRDPHDWDVTTSASPEETKKLFRRTIDTGIEHGTVTVMMDKEGVEVTTYRIDGKYEDSRHPSEVIFTRNLRDDLLRRDFTINAMAYNDQTGLVDMFNGIDDLNNKIIRCVGDPMQRLSEDALRILRAVRFSAQLDFTIEDNTKLAIKKLTPLLKNISAERICQELIKTITSSKPGKLIEAYELGATAVFLPEFDKMMQTEQNTVHHLYSVGEHTIKAMEAIPADKVLRLTMLLHDIGKPDVKTTDDYGVDHFKTHAIKSEQMAKQIMKRLKLDNDTIKKVCMLIRYHDWRGNPSETNIRKLTNVLGNELMESLILVQKADQAGKSQYRIDEKLKLITDIEDTYLLIKERGDCTSVKELKINGSKIMELGVKKGPKIGEILAAALEDVINYPEHNNEEYLIDFAKKYLMN